MSFDAQVPHAIATLQKEATSLRSQIRPLQDKIDLGYKSDESRCGCDCSACDDCEERDYLDELEIEELEAERKPLDEKLCDIETTIRRLQRWAEFRHIELKPEKQLMPKEADRE